MLEVLEAEQATDISWFQPSLRDLWDVESIPGSELPGYSRLSLRESKMPTPMAKLQRQALVGIPDNAARSVEAHDCFDDAGFGAEPAGKFADQSIEFGVVG